MIREMIIEKKIEKETDKRKIFIITKPKKSKK